jgi:hypothetical protein
MIGLNELAAQVADLEKKANVDQVEPSEKEWALVDASKAELMPLRMLFRPGSRRSRQTQLHIEKNSG